MRYTDLVKKEKELTIPTDSGDLVIIYNQTYFSRDNSALNVNDDITKIDFVVNAFTNGLLIKWNLKNDKDKVIPITKKELSKINMDFLVELYHIIQDDTNFFLKKQ